MKQGNSADSLLEFPFGIWPMMRIRDEARSAAAQVPEILTAGVVSADEHSVGADAASLNQDKDRILRPKARSNSIDLEPRSRRKDAETGGKS